MGIEAVDDAGTGNDEERMVEQVEHLGARRLAEIVVNHCHRDERLQPDSVDRVGGFDPWRPRSTPFAHLGTLMGTVKATSWPKSSTGSERGSPNTFSPHSPVPLPSCSNVSSGSTRTSTNDQMTQMA